jgi:hypothetical protein
VHDWRIDQSSFARGAESRWCAIDLDRTRKSFKEVERCAKEERSVVWGNWGIVFNSWGVEKLPPSISSSPRYFVQKV